MHDMSMRQHLCAQRGGGQGQLGGWMNWRVHLYGGVEASTAYSLAPAATACYCPQIKGETVRMRSTVHIKKCRYLEDSGCTGMCVNMCKMPTQTFFTDDFGLPLTMTPNFEDLSCDMVFGQVRAEGWGGGGA